jgi:D-glycerate 3-kinase
MHHSGMVTRTQVDAFVSQHGLPTSFGTLIAEHYAPLVAWLAKERRPGEQTLLGINGAQGSGKSTLADFIRMALENNAGWTVAVMSIDDFYLTKSEREWLGEQVHPLLVTRGVPGTHDLRLLDETLLALHDLRAGDTLRLPRFDKARDDRADPAAWPVVTGPVDLVILEGWCVGSRAQDEAALREPVNALERERDSDGVWRRYVNEQLAGPYAELFARLDTLVLLQVPGFDAVYRWRLEQEQKLAAQTRGDGIMDEQQIADFIQHFERITRHNLECLPASAEVVLELDDSHACVRTVYKS